MFCGFHGSQMISGRDRWDLVAHLKSGPTAWGLLVAGCFFGALHCTRTPSQCSGDWQEKGRPMRCCLRTSARAADGGNGGHGGASSLGHMQGRRHALECSSTSGIDGSSNFLALMGVASRCKDSRTTHQARRFQIRTLTAGCLEGREAPRSPPGPLGPPCPRPPARELGEAQVVDEKAALQCCSSGVGPFWFGVEGSETTALTAR